MIDSMWVVVVVVFDACYVLRQYKQAVDDIWDLRIIVITVIIIVIIIIVTILYSLWNTFMLKYFLICLDT